MDYKCVDDLLEVLPPEAVSLVACGDGRLWAGAEGRLILTWYDRAYEEGEHDEWRTWQVSGAAEILELWGEPGFPLDEEGRDFLSGCVSYCSEYLARLHKQGPADNAILNEWYHRARAFRALRDYAIMVRGYALTVEGGDESLAWRAIREGQYCAVGGDDPVHVSGIGAEGEWGVMSRYELILRVRPGGFGDMLRTIGEEGA